MRLETISFLVILMLFPAEQFQEIMNLKNVYQEI